MAYESRLLTNIKKLGKGILNDVENMWTIKQVAIVLQRETHRYECVKYQHVLCQRCDSNPWRHKN